MERRCGGFFCEIVAWEWLVRLGYAAKRGTGVERTGKKKKGICLGKAGAADLREDVFCEWREICHEFLEMKVKESKKGISYA